MGFTASIEGNELVLRLPIAQRPSKSGKTQLVASTNGGKTTNVTVAGKPVVVSVNAYIYPDKAA